MDVSRRADDDRGAAAVEMAIVTPLLLLLLFGIIQYGMLFHSMQAASATARDAARQAAHGTSDCSFFAEGVKDDATGNGVPATSHWRLEMIYDETPAEGNPLGTATVDLAYTPQDFLRLIPMPGELHQKAVAAIEDSSAVKVSGCLVTP